MQRCVYIKNMLRRDVENMKDAKFYIDSFPYEIELTARVCHENARRLFESCTSEISLDEFTVLDTLIAKSGLSQADLARLILKGKAHTGRFLMALEDKGIIERHVEERDGKLIKVATVTKKGQEIYADVVAQFRPAVEKFDKVITEEDCAKIIENLRKLRSAIEEVGKIVFE